MDSINIITANEYHNGSIAEFMNVKVVTLDEIRSNKEPVFSSADGYTVEDLQYHTSWNWIMPVVERIENLGYEFTIVESRCNINHNTDQSIEELLNLEILGSKIECTYQAVVDFIKQQ